MGTDEDWEAYGARDPYYGVLTAPRYRAGALDEAARREFFATGEARIAQISRRLEDLYGPFSPRTALDFGCGVGRLTLPLASRCVEVTAIDVSPSMLREAESNCRARGVDNVTFARADDSLSALAGRSFDLIVTDLVLQHVPLSRGRRLVRALLDRLAPGGAGAFGVPYAKTHALAGLRAALGRVPFARRAVHLARGDVEPPMQMNAYPLGWLVSELQAHGVERVSADLWQQGHVLLAMLYFRRSL